MIANRPSNSRRANRPAQLARMACNALYMCTHLLGWHPDCRSAVGRQIGSPPADRIRFFLYHIICKINFKNVLFQKTRPKLGGGSSKINVSTWVVERKEASS
jgi:hypothetical protein